jgi:hypothetical protein
VGISGHEWLGDVWRAGETHSTRLLTLPTHREALQVELEYFAHGGILHYVLRSLKRKG